MTRRVLVTGASGFVGRQILPHLRGTEIHAVSRKPNKAAGIWHIADLTDCAVSAALVRKLRPDILVHAAWETEHGKFWHAESNRAWLKASQSMFDAMREIPGARIVALGTCAEYPLLDRAARETDCMATPSTLYGRCKRNLLLHLTNGMANFAWARIFHAYGPGEDPRRFVPQVVSALAKGIPAQCSSGTQLRDFVDVRDLGRAIAKLAVSDLTGAINLGSGAALPLGDVARELGRIAGRPDLICLGALPDRPDNPEILIPDVSRQTRELGFRPAISLQEGLADAFRYWTDARAS